MPSLPATSQFEPLNHFRLGQARLFNRAKMQIALGAKQDQPPARRGVMASPFYFPLQACK